MIANADSRAHLTMKGICPFVTELVVDDSDTVTLKVQHTLMFRSTPRQLEWCEGAGLA